MMDNLKQIIERLDQLKVELDGLRPIDSDALYQLNQKLRLEWNYHSNHIEGNSLTLSETKSFILFGVTAKGKPFRDYLEMKGHNEALKKLEAIVSKDLKITEKLIKEFHELILVEPYVDGNAEINPGKYKTRNNYLISETGERIDFAHKDDVPALISDLVNWLNNQISPPKRKKKKYNLHPLLVAAQFHIRFVKIHPFGDGNGRMARILTNLILMLTGYAPAIVKADLRKGYYLALDDNAPEDFSVFLGKACIESMELTIRAAKGESLAGPEDWKKEVALLGKELSAKGQQETLEQEELLRDRVAGRRKWLEENLPLIFKAFEDTFLPFEKMAKVSTFRLTYWGEDEGDKDVVRLLGGTQFVEKIVNYFEKKVEDGKFDISYYFEGLTAYPKIDFYFKARLAISFNAEFASVLVYDSVGPESDGIVLYGKGNTYRILKNLDANLNKKDLNCIQVLGAQLVKEIKKATSI